MRISLPTEGVYAQAIMDDCEACEEHFGSTDWVLSDKEPELAEFPDSFFDSRKSVTPANTDASQMPAAIINLQNAPAAPDPAGFGNVLNTLGSSNSFRDQAGLAGTQENARHALEQAAGLATSFG